MHSIILLHHISDILVGVSVSHVIKMVLEQLPELQSELNELVLKVCGRDEYLDKLVFLCFSLTLLI